MRTPLVMLVLSLVCGCTASRGFDRGALRSEVLPRRVIAEEEIRQAIAARPQLPHPFTLAVYFAPPPTPQWYRRVEWSWTGEDKDRLLSAFDRLRSKGVIADVFVIPEGAMEGTDGKAIRLAAARTGAHAVLVVSGAADIDRYNNALGPAYILLVTAFFVPGTVVDGLFMVHAAMWDVGNQFLYLGAEAEGAASETAPAFFIAEKQIVKDAKRAALDSLATDVSGRLDRMKEAGQ